MYCFYVSLAYKKKLSIKKNLPKIDKYDPEMLLKKKKINKYILNYAIIIMIHVNMYP